MASIVIAGDTSGTCTISAPAVAGTPTLTLPTTSGTVLTSASSVTSGQLPVGSILQVSNFNYGSTVTTTSGSLSDTGLTGTITPKFATSKILVLVEHNGCAKNNNTYMQVVLLRGATQLATFGNAIGYTGTTLDLRFGGIGMCYMDYPATTSTLTYKTQFCSVTNAATVTLQDNNGLSTLTLMEIAV